MMYSKKNSIRNLGLFLFPLTLALPLPMIYSAIAFNLFIAYLVLTVRKTEIATLKKAIFHPIALLFIILFLSDSLNVILIQDFNNQLFRDVRVPFLIAPIIMLMRADLLKKHYKSALIIFSLSVFIYIITAWGYVFYFYSFKYPNYIFDFTDHYVVYVLSNEFPYSIHHTYIGMYILIVTVYFFYNTLITKKIKLFTGIIVSLFFLFNSFYIGGKGTSFLIIAFMLIIISKSLIKNQIKGFIFYLGVFSLVCLIGLYGIKEWLSISIESSVGFRYDVYIRCIEVIKEIFPFGIGKDGLNNILLDSANLSSGALITHNIYFNESIINGLLGLLTLLSLLSYLFYKGYRNSTIFTLFVISIILIGATEDLLSRQRGVLFFTYLALLFFINVKGDNENRKHNAIIEEE